MKGESIAMGSQVRIRHVAALIVPVAGVVVAVLLLPEEALAAELRSGFRTGLVGVAAADPRWLAVTSALLAASLACSALGWRAALRACGVRCGPVDAVARYGVGSLANALLPARIGGVLRIALFSRLVQGEGAVWTTGGAAAVTGIARSLWLAVLAALASTTGLLPVWPALVLLALSVAGLGIALVAVRTRFRARVAHVLDAVQALSARPRAAAAVLIAAGAAIAARVVSAIALARAVGVERPVTAGLLAVAAIELAAILPVSAGGAGTAGGAVAFAFAAHGVAGSVALSAGIALAAAEAFTAITVGGMGAAVLGLPGIVRWVRRAPAVVPLTDGVPPVPQRARP
jgi:uncharacterized membrane protein YbhN (UPF0104 family)